MAIMIQQRLDELMTNTSNAINAAESIKDLETVKIKVFGKNGELTEILKGLKEIKIIEFDHNDVVRHPLVSKIIRAYQTKKIDDKD